MFASIIEGNLDTSRTKRVLIRAPNLSCPKVEDVRKSGVEDTQGAPNEARDVSKSPL